VWKPKIRIEDAADLLDTCVESPDSSLYPNHQQEQPYNLLHPSQPPPPPQLPSPTKENPTSSLSLSGGAAMANFPVNPRPFLVAGLQVEHGWNRPARGRIALGGEPTRDHEDYAVVSITPMPLEDNELRRL
jgi:hypothetical protein